MKLFTRSKSRKLRKEIEQFPDPVKGLSPEAVVQYLKKLLELSKAVDETVNHGDMDRELGEALKKSLQQKGLKDPAVRMILEGQLYKQ